MRDRIVVRARRHHAEALPRLDLREARRQVLAGRGELLWRDQRGRVRGKASVTLERDRLTVTADFGEEVADPIRVKQDDFHLRLVGHGINPTDCLAHCGRCGKEVRLFFMKNNAWRCRNCQGLGYRSTMIGEVARKSERLEELEVQLADGRPKGMHESTYQKLREELSELRLLVGEARSTASSAYGEIITAYWHEEGPEIRFEGKPYTGQNLIPR